jgi:hypothetical protein
VKRVVITSRLSFIEAANIIRTVMPLYGSSAFDLMPAFSFNILCFRFYASPVSQPKSLAVARPARLPSPARAEHYNRREGIGTA